MKYWKLSLLLPFVFYAPAYAGKVHAHGFAKLGVELANKTLKVEFSSPAADIFGFESKKKAKAQPEKVKSVIAKFQKPEKIFGIQSSSKCSVKEMEIKAFGKEYGSHKMEEKKHKHGHKHDKHKHDHKKHDHDKHKHDKHDHGKHEEHSELMASYTFSCAGDIEKDGMKLAIIETFPSIKNIDIIVFSGKGQQGMKGKKAIIPLNFKN